MPVDPTPTAEPNLDSFVLRFVRTGALAANDWAQAGGWHGVIRHVQSNRERAFSRWADAVAFIGEFVDVHEHGEQESGNA